MAVVAVLGVDEMRLPAPARPGDELWLTSTLLEKRESRSGSGRGIARYHSVVRNAGGEVVVEFKITGMLARRASP